MLTRLPVATPPSRSMRSSIPPSNSQGFDIPAPASCLPRSLSALPSALYGLKSTRDRFKDQQNDDGRRVAMDTSKGDINNYEKFWKRDCRRSYVARICFRNGSGDQRDRRGPVSE